MVNPTVEVLRGADESATGDDGPSPGRIYPVYPLTEKASLTSARIGRLVHEALDRAGPFADPVRRGWSAADLGLVDRTAAFAGIHRPTAMAEIEPARRRLAFDELLRLQLALVLRRQRLHEDARGIRPRRRPGPTVPTLVDQFIGRLPVPADRGPARAVADLSGDLAGPLPMHRLLQGDVGSGKTVVAVAALLIGVEGGHQGALMAPTEVLAEQHARRGPARWSTGSTVPDSVDPRRERPLRVGLLTSRTGAGRADRHPSRGWPAGPSTS